MMATWKTRLALAVALVSLLTGSTLAVQVSAQNAMPLAMQPRTDSQNQRIDRLTESTDLSESPTRSLPRLAPLVSIADYNDQVVSRHSKIANSEYPQTLNASIPDTVDDAVGRHANQPASMPTVIVRPPMNPARSLNDLTVDVQKIVTQTGDEYSLQIVIPESVKVVEITPAGSGNVSRNFKIRVAETGHLSTQQEPLMQLPPKAAAAPLMPVHPASASLDSRAPSGRQAMPTLQQDIQGEMEPVRADAQRLRFQKNPFYQPPATKSQDRTASVAARQVRHIAQASVASSLPTQSTSSQATYFAESQSLAINFADSKLNAQLLGPAELGLDDVQEFEARVHNHSTEIATEISVQLTVPAGLDVTRVDIGSDIDSEARRIMWKLAKLAPGQSHSIRFEVRSLIQGNQNLQLLVQSAEEGLGVQANQVIEVSANRPSPISQLTPFAPRQSRVE